MSSGPYRFSFEPVFLVLALVLAVLYARDVRRSGPDERPSRGRACVFGLGLALIALPLNSPLETLSAHSLLLVHLLQNALIADWGPPLLILGLTPGMRERIGRAGGSGFRRLTSPFVALPIWLAVWYGVHLPPLYDWALRDGWPLNLEHLLLIGCRPAVLVARVRAPAAAGDGRDARLPRDRVCDRTVALARLHLLLAAVLLVLRPRAAALGTLGRSTTRTTPAS